MLRQLCMIWAVQVILAVLFITRPDKESEHSKQVECDNDSMHEYRSAAQLEDKNKDLNKRWMEMVEDESDDFVLFNSQPKHSKTVRVLKNDVMTRTEERNHERNLSSSDSDTESNDIIA